MDLPPILAGPILRRVESNLVAVWLALCEPYEVTLSLWEGGQVKADDGDPIDKDSESAVKPVRVGENLYVVVATRKLGEGRRLQAGRIYSYDVTLFDAATGEKHTLTSLGLLADEEGKHLMLGFETNVLPSFATCPPDLTDLKLVHGSCRRASADLPDGLGG